MVADNPQDVQDAPARPLQETTANFFAALLSGLRYACEQNGLDFAALSQSEGDADAETIVKHLSTHVGIALQTERRKGICEESGEDLLGVRTILHSFALAVAIEPRYREAGQYIGKALHIYEANKDAVLDAFKQACQKKAAGLTLRIEFPTFQTGNPTQDAWYHVGLRTYLPRPHGFAVVDATDDSGYYTLRKVKTWEEALQVVEAIPTTYDAVRQIHALDAQGLFPDDVDLQTNRRDEGTDAPELPEMAT